MQKVLGFHSAPYSYSILGVEKKEGNVVAHHV